MIEEQAALWAARQHAGLDSSSHASLQAWLAADPRHAAAAESMTAILQNVRRLPAHESAKLSESFGLKSGAYASPPKPSVWRFFTRPLFTQTFAAIAVVTVVGVAGWDWWTKPTFEQNYATERGQQILATLPDDPMAGSTVQLDTATRMHARLFRDRREVELQDGQAMFVVHPDKTRPFHVIAGDLSITVVGTRFSVRHTASGMDAGRTVVAVEEGHVRVTRMPSKATDATKEDLAKLMVDLTAGQMLAGDASGDIGPVTSITPAAVAQWRSGRISFDQTSLVQALAEFERYASTGLVVHDPAVAALPVGGSYSLRQSRLFAEALPHVLPVRLVKKGEVTEIVAR